MNDDCPLPFGTYDRVVLAHGAGGRLSARLIREVFVAAFDDPALHAAHDAATLAFEGELAVTTDAFTVHPLFFPGGDLGSLAVHGTVNDLACAGAEPLAMTVAFVLEEGLPLETLKRLVESLARAAREASIRIVAGDTKVVERGHGDGVYLSCTGLGRVRRRLGPDRLEPGLAVLVSGPLGDHGTAVMLAREPSFEADVTSDAASTWPLVRALLDADVDLRCLRDPTRGGLVAVAHELAGRAFTLALDEAAIPVRAEVADVCELLGLDPFHVASEGRLVAFVAAEDTERALGTWRAAGATECACIGVVHERGEVPVTLRTKLGSTRVLDLPAGAPLPRIC
ncbi:MAG: hydrogenase expression/formation protein HypE [Sandaracinus sp.]|nr:hydrogenase expression/formation protein HypE [Sandaracinus sp.]MCB9630991.1 hydrogenase expression/formation protein HypE [Sandaracinus sp.]